MNDLHPVIDQRRNDPAYHPAAGKGPDDQQNDQSRSHTGNIIDHRQLDRFPANFAVSHGDQATNGCRRKQYHLASPAQSVAAERPDGDKQKGYQYKYRNQ